MTMATTKKPSLQYMQLRIICNASVLSRSESKLCINCLEIKLAWIRNLQRFSN